MRFTSLILLPFAAQALLPTFSCGDANVATCQSLSPLSALSSIENDEGEGEENLSTAENGGLSPRAARIVGPLSAAILGGTTPLDQAAAASATSWGQFESTLAATFPGSIANSQLAFRVVETLRKRGFSDENTLLGSSLCSDEINDVPTSLLSQLQRSLTKGNSGGIFNLGGLGGVPFVGPSGFGAFFSHCPKSGNIIIVYGPHVGIGADGVVGKVERVGMGRQSSACGAALGAYTAIKAEKERAEKVNPTPSESFPYSDSGAEDVQEDYIIRELRKKLENDNLGSSNDNALVALVTNRMYEMVSELLEREVDAASSNLGFWDKVTEVTLLGGIVVNKGNPTGYGNVEDYFMPLNFQALQKGGASVDMYNSLYKYSDSLIGLAPIGNRADLPTPPAPTKAKTKDGREYNVLVGQVSAAAAAVATVNAASTISGRKLKVEGTNLITDLPSLPRVTPLAPEKSPRKSLISADLAAGANSAKAKAKARANDGLDLVELAHVRFDPISPRTETAPAPTILSMTNVALEEELSSFAPLVVELLVTALTTNRGISASPSQRLTAANIISVLESTTSTPGPTSTANIQGTWELLYTDTQLFRSNPFFMAKRAACVNEADIREFDSFCMAQDTLLNVNSVGKIRQVVSSTRIVSEFEIDTGTLDIAFVGAAYLTPTDAGKAWEVSFDRSYLDESNVPGVHHFLDSKKGLDTTSTSMFATTYLDESFRISRDQDNNVFVFEKVSEDTEPKDYASVLTSPRVGNLVTSLS